MGITNTDSKVNQGDEEIGEDTLEHFDPEDLEDMELQGIDLQTLAEEWKNKDPTAIPKEKIQIITRAYLKHQDQILHQAQYIENHNHLGRRTPLQNEDQ